jgi:hypothetical protein
MTRRENLGVPSRGGKGLSKFVSGSASDGDAGGSSGTGSGGSGDEGNFFLMGRLGESSLSRSGGCI